VFLAGFLLGMFALGLVAVVVVNVKQQPPPKPVPIHEERYRIGGDA
jgi:hypothetical protein